MSRSGIRRAIFGLVLVGFAAPATGTVAGTTSWLCTGDQAVGFANKGGEWQIAQFRPSGKYVIKPLPDELVRYSPELKYGATEFGKAGPGYCRPHFLYPDVWDCGIITFSKSTLRFMHMFEGSYVHDPLETDTPVIEIGTCVALD